MKAEEARLGTGDELVRRSWQMPIAYRSIGLAVMAIDIAIVFAASLCAGAVYHRYRLGYTGDLVHYVGIAVVVSVLFTLAMRGKDLYETAALLALMRQLRAVTVFWLGLLAAFAMVAFLLRVNGAFSRGAAVMFTVAGLAGLLGHRMLWARALADGRIRSRLRGPRVALVTLHPAGAPRTLLERHGFRVVEAVDLSAVAPEALAAALSGTFQALRGRDVAEVYIAAGGSDVAVDDAFLAAFRVLPLPVRLLPAPATRRMLERPARRLGTTTAVDLQRGPLDPVETTLKRSLDVAFAGLGLIALSPLLCFVALAVRLDTPGPVFFRQSRAGFNGRTFRILKFRSMSVMEDGGKVLQARRGDARVTRVGRWIRRTSVDELPQLLNVMRGEMSLVGPRPHALAHDDHYGQLIGDYAFRHHMKPGLTGWAQVNGHRGETETVDAMTKRVEHDLWYVDHWSLWLDIRIIVRTALGILDIRNVY